MCFELAIFFLFTSLPGRYLHCVTVLFPPKQAKRRDWKFYGNPRIEHTSVTPFRLASIMVYRGFWNLFASCQNGQPLAFASIYVIAQNAAEMFDRQYSLSWGFWNFFKQIQNQQKAGIQDCIWCPCIQIVSQKI